MKAPLSASVQYQTPPCHSSTVIRQAGYWCSNLSGSSSVTHTNTGWIMWSLKRSPHRFLFSSFSVCSTSSQTFANKRQNLFEHILISSCSERLEHRCPSRTSTSSNGSLRSSKYSAILIEQARTARKSATTSLSSSSLRHADFILLLLFLLHRRQIQLEC